MRRSSYYIEDEPEEAEDAGWLSSIMSIFSCSCGSSEEGNANQEDKKDGILNMTILITEFIVTALLLIGPFMATATLQEGISKNKDYVIMSFAVSTFIFYLLFPRAQLNPAATVASMVCKDTTIIQGCFNILFQCMGSTLSSSLVQFIYQDEKGVDWMCNVVFNTDGFNTILGEYITTLLLIVAMQKFPVATAVFDRAIRSLVMSFFIYGGYNLLWKIDLGSMNFARTFGPAMVDTIHGYFSGLLNVEGEVYANWSSAGFVAIGTLSGGFAAGLFDKWSRTHPYPEIERTMNYTDAPEETAENNNTAPGYNFAFQKRSRSVSKEKVQPRLSPRSSPPNQSPAIMGDRVMPRTSRRRLI